MSLLYLRSLVTAVLGGHCGYCVLYCATEFIEVRNVREHLCQVNSSSLWHAENSEGYFSLVKPLQRTVRALPLFLRGEGSTENSEGSSSMVKALQRALPLCVRL